MQFTSFAFFVFMLVVLLCTRYLFVTGTPKKVFLLCASYLFYMCWDWRFGFLLLFISLVNYFLGQRIYSATSMRQKKSLLALSLLVSLGTLFYFKYFNFFLDSLAGFLAIFEIELDNTFRILLPVGISFYTFQSISYTLDIYREKEKPIHSPLEFILFVSFFPQLVAGPIVRAIDFLPQLQKDTKSPVYDSKKDNDGLLLIFIGLIKKIVFADILGTHIVDPTYGNPSEYSSAVLWIGIYAYSFQVYMDFSAYTDIARGIAKLLGYELPINFNRPYLAKSVSNFWQRWHISMSSFFRDYLFFGLGGSKKGNVYINLVITFVAIGIWHGAGWNFILYGFIHAGLVCSERFFRNRFPNFFEQYNNVLLFNAANIFYIFTIISLARIVFRAENLELAKDYFVRMLSFETTGLEVSNIGILILIVCLLLHLVPQSSVQSLFRIWSYQKILVKAAALVTITYVLTAFYQGGAPFIYFQF